MQRFVTSGIRGCPFQIIHGWRRVNLVAGTGGAAEDGDCCYDEDRLGFRCVLQDEVAWIWCHHAGGVGVV